MPGKNGFILFAAICCFLSVVTTLGIHLYFPEPPAGFEQRALLHKNTLYIINRWWVIVHCLLVVVAMWGFALLLWKTRPGTAGLGFLFFAVFAVAEITRQMFVLFYMNELREQYAVAGGGDAKENIRRLLTYAGLLMAPLFGLFILMFALGNLSYGLSLWSGKGFSKWLGVLLVFWGISGLVVLGNQFWKVEGIDKITGIYNYTFQPLVRLLMGIWLWQKTMDGGTIDRFPLLPGKALKMQKV